MAFDLVNLEIQDNDNILAKIFGEYPAKYEHFVNEALDDIADEIEFQASIFAPERSGKLKEEPTVREDVRGFVEKRAPLFVKKGQTPGTVFASRGATGFVKGSGGVGGRETRHIEITLPGEGSRTHYAYFVHYGTEQYAPIYPTHHPLLKFRSRGRGWALPFVGGQAPQPYLFEAFEDVDHTYVPIRLQELRAAIEAWENI